MTLDEIRINIDRVDKQIKNLFIERMKYAEEVASAKKVTGANVFVLEREIALISKNSQDISSNIRPEYIIFLKNLMSLSRHHQYSILSKMQEEVIKTVLTASNIDPTIPHDKIAISFSCNDIETDISIFLNMIKLNNVKISSMSLFQEENTQKVSMILDDNLQNRNVILLICQLYKETRDFKLVEIS